MVEIQAHTESPPKTLTSDEARRKKQFITFMRWVQGANLPVVLIDAVAGFVLNIFQLYVLALTSLALLLVATVAQRAARAGRLHTGVYLFIAGLFTIIGSFPLLASGLLSTILIGHILAITLVGLFLSPRLILRTTVITAVVSLFPMLLELWGPFSVPNASGLNLLLAMIFIVFVGYLIHLFGNNLSQTLVAAQSYAGELERSQAELTARSRDLEATAAELAVQRAELEETNLRLEEMARTSQRRAAMLQAGAEVSRVVAQIRDPDRLLPQVTQLISQHFGFYHVGFFMVDQAGRYAVLRAASSKGGQRMLARRHKLVLGSEGIVGYVTSTGRPRIALDVGEDAVYFDNPDLPDTRSEMAVPLRSGDQVIGALDVQSTTEAAFTEEDVTALTALADQVAIAIENARLFQEHRAALSQAEEAYRRYLRQEWDSFLGGRPGKRPASQLRTISLTEKADTA
jgi:putative methionine-R-sulfoxide reductase with GAF domain